MELLHAGSGDFVHAALRPRLGAGPGGANKAVFLEAAESPVKPPWIPAREAERGQPLEQVVAVGRPLAPQQEKARSEEVAREARRRRLSGHGPSPPGTAPPPPARTDP